MDGYAHRPAGGRCARNAQSLVPHPGELWNTAPCHRDGTRHPSRHKRLWRIRVRMSPPHPIPSLPCLQVHEFPDRRLSSLLCFALLCSALFSSAQQVPRSNYQKLFGSDQPIPCHRCGTQNSTPAQILSLSATHTASTQPTTRRAPAHAVQCAAVHTSRLSK
jgi:hypothetical protein